MLEKLGKSGLDLGSNLHYGQNYKNQKTKNSSGEIGVGAETK